MLLNKETKPTKPSKNYTKYLHLDLGGGAFSITIIVVGNEIGEQCSNRGFAVWVSLIFLGKA